MDTSETYIKMSDCEELQGIWSKADCKLLPSFVYDTTTKSVATMIWTPSKLAEIIRKEHPGQGNSLIASIEWWDEKNIGYEDEDDLWRQDTIWLPRQDQLQEMVRPNWKKLPYMLTTTFNEAVNGGSCSYVWDSGKHFTSMEQLWLAFVMKEKYNKVWDSKEWI